MKERVYKTESLNPWQKRELCAPFAEGERVPQIRFKHLLNPDRAPSYHQFKRGGLMCFVVENKSDHPATVELVVFEESP